MNKNDCIFSTSGSGLNGYTYSLYLYLLILTPVNGYTGVSHISGEFMPLCPMDMETADMWDVCKGLNTKFPLLLLHSYSWKQNAYIWRWGMQWQWTFTRAPVVFLHGGNIWKWHAFQWERPSRQRVIQSHLQKAQAIPNICMESAQMSDPISRISLGCSLIPNCRWNWSQMVIYKYPRKWDGWLGN